MKDIILIYQKESSPVTFSCLLNAEFDLHSKGVQIKNLTHGVVALSKGQKVVRGIYSCMNKAVQFYIHANSSCTEVLEGVADVLHARIEEKS